MTNRQISQLVGIGTAVLLSSHASADVFSESAKLGANAGAMEYCEDNFANKEDKGRYKMIRLKLLGELGDLPDDQKAKAVILQKAAEDDGDYLGKELDADRCERLRKTLYLKY
jgi:hypothetical protein